MAPPTSPRSDSDGGWLTVLADTMQGYLSSPGFTPVAILVALAAGGAHALAPGHGKTLAAAYLTGSKGRIRDAVWLGGSVAVMHTFSVLVVAIGWAFFSLSDIVQLESLTTALQLFAGLLVIGTGIWLIRHHLGHRHGHEHKHGYETARPGIVLLGISGGLVPSPAAFLVLVTGLFSGRAGLALVLVICFGLGLAGVLFTVGLLAVSGRNLVVRALSSRAIRLVTRVAPVLAAGGITLLGCGITGIAVMQLEIL